MDQESIEEELHQVIDQVNQRKITSPKFCLILLDKARPFYYLKGNKII